ncbi:MAG: DUF6273 domain-containing protein [Erysipelotrichaceae bacterium]|jgi:hypothetical protein|nr:DUF6273 domain-containing protein [Erysipelotrichaceae bacterium]
MKKNILKVAAALIMVVGSIMMATLVLREDFVTKVKSYDLLNSDTNSDDSSLVAFGSYPTSYVNPTQCADIFLNLETITTENTYGYLEYDGAQYKKVIATPYEANSELVTFNDGTEIITGETYYFKVEPIRWRVLDWDNGLLVSEKLLEPTVFNDFTTATDHSWEHSALRSYLNNDFYEHNFTPLEQASIIEKTYLADVPGSENYGDYLPTNDTIDKVSLLNLTDLRNNTYGFDEYYVYDDCEETHLAATTEYARASGASFQTFQENQGIIFPDRNSEFLGAYYSRSRRPNGMLLTVHSLGAFGMLDPNNPLDDNRYCHRPVISVDPEILPKRIIGSYLNRYSYLPWGWNLLMDFEIFDVTWTEITYFMILSYDHEQYLKFTITKNGSSIDVYTGGELLRTVDISANVGITNSLVRYNALYFLDYWPAGTSTWFDIVVTAKNETNQHQVHYDFLMCHGVPPL